MHSGQAEVLVLGGTGYLGRAIVSRLVQANFRPLVLVRPGKPFRLPAKFKDQVTVLYGDADRLDLLKSELTKRNVVGIIYSIGLIRESYFSGAKFMDYHYSWAKFAVDLATRLQISKFVYISANGIDRARAQYARTKLMAESYVKRSQLNYTIVRPGLILGSDRSPHFMNKLKLLVRFKLVPLIDGGNYSIQPVFRDDVAEVVVKSLDDMQLNRTTVTLCGPEQVTFKELLHRTAAHYGVKISTFSFPAFLIHPFAKLFRKFPLFPISDEQLELLLAGNTYPDAGKIWAALNITPKSITEMLATYKVNLEPQNLAARVGEEQKQ